MVVGASCAPPEHPNNPGTFDEICKPSCDKQHECDATQDPVSCLNGCRHSLSSRAIYYNADYVAALSACSKQQTCNGNVAQSISTCQRDAKARFPETGATRLLCVGRVEKDHVCGDRRSDFEHCVYGFKTYSDAILGQLRDCLENPCNSYGRCAMAVVGEDAIADDRDRRAEFYAKEVPKARATIALTGKTVTSGTSLPIAGAKVCVHDRPEVPCGTSEVDGHFTMQLPAAQEVAVEITAPDHAPILVALVTQAVDLKNWSIGVPKDATLRARYSAFGATYPDTAKGFVRATAHGPSGGMPGLEGMQMSIEPKSGAGAFYFAPNSDPAPERQLTSTWATGLFANIAPGTIEVSFGPTAIVCTPGFGSWPSTKPNTARVPVAAGFETQLVQRCNR